MCASLAENNPFGQVKEALWDNASPTAKIIQDRVITEAVQWSVFFGVGYVLHHHVQMKPIKQVMAKIISPFVGGIDAIADNVLPALETEEQAEIRQKMSKEERAYFYADELLDLGLSIGLSLVLQSRFQEWIDNKRGVEVAYPSHSTGNQPANILTAMLSNPYNRATIADTGIKWTAFAVGNVALPNQSRQMQEGIASVMEKFGIEKEKAQSIGTFTMNYCAPNLLGMATSVGLLSSQHEHASR